MILALFKMSLSSKILFFAIFYVRTLADELVLVHAAWRHGDKAPEGTYKNDPYQEDAWPVGWGELTNVRILNVSKTSQFMNLQQLFVSKTHFRSFLARNAAAFYTRSKATATLHD